MNDGQIVAVSYSELAARDRGYRREREHNDIRCEICKGVLTRDYRASRIVLEGFAVFITGPALDND